MVTNKQVIKEWLKDKPAINDVGTLKSDGDILVVAGEDNRKLVIGYTLPDGKKVVDDNVPLSPRVAKIIELAEKLAETHKPA